MRSKILLFLFSAVLAVGAVFGVTNFAKAAITQSGPPIYDMFKDTVIGPGGLYQISQIYGSRRRDYGFDQSRFYHKSFLPRWIR